MIITLDTVSSIPIYVQLRNQIVTGIGRGELKAGEKLPTVRQMAQDAGINNMTVNKTYQILKTEGFIDIDRRKGATVRAVQSRDDEFLAKLESAGEGRGETNSNCFRYSSSKSAGRICRHKRYLRPDPSR